MFEMYNPENHDKRGKSIGFQQVENIDLYRFPDGKSQVSIFKDYK